MLNIWKLKLQELRGENRRWLIFLNRSFRGVAISLVVLFSPIYIYKTLLALTGKTNLALSAVFLFYFLLYFFKFIANLLAEELARRWGLKRQMYIGLGFSFLSLLALFWSQQNPLWLVAAPILWGLSTGFFWFGSLGMLLKVSTKGTYGRQWGLGEAVDLFSSMVVPVTGGFLISRWDYGALFGVAILLVMTAFLTILPLGEIKTKVDTNFKEVWRLFLSHPRPVLAYIGHHGATEIYAVVLPLYLFLILQKEISLGGFFSLSAVAVAGLSLLVGRWTDRGRKQLVIRVGSISQVVIWVARGLTRAVTALFFLNVADRMTSKMLAIPMGADSYQKATDGRSTGRALLFREQAITLGGLAVFLVIEVWVFFGGRLEATFWLAAGLSLLPLLESGKKSKIDKIP